MSMNLKQLQLRLRTAEIHLDAALLRRDKAAPASPEFDEWNGIVYACMSEARHVRSDLNRARQAQACAR